jgi:integrase
MPRIAKELSALEVSRLKSPGMHAVGGVPGLHLQVVPSGGRTWVLRFMVGERRREMGLGGYPAVTLAQAKDRAREARDMVDHGVDPIEQRREAKSALLAKAAAGKTFAQAATAFVEAKSAEWRNDKHVAQWSATLETYAKPVIGQVLVSDVTLAHILKILEPIWTTKTETASRVRGRIEAVLDWATVRGYRTGENPARWRGHLDKILPAPNKVAKPEHHRAIEVDEASAFFAAVREQAGTGARALEFAMLTAARSGEVRGATWAEIDLEAGVWTVPAERMKAHREHRVPLSKAAVKLLSALQRIEGCDLVFPSPRNKVLSDMALTETMRRMSVDAVPHGLRSTFKDWASERTNYPGELSEMALAHTIASKVESAYRRGDLFEKRRRMMADWVRFLETTPSKGGEVVPFEKRRAANKS